jgi:hypothetical protein
MITSNVGIILIAKTLSGKCQRKIIKNKEDGQRKRDGLKQKN